MFYVFGSENSTDYDIMCILSKMPESKFLCKEMCLFKEKELSSKFPDKKVNVNLAVLENGIINQVYKGTFDECNNSILRTYNLHDQHYKLLIERWLPRDIPLKIARCLRIILTFLSRTEYRVEVKKALFSNATAKIKCLQNINLNVFDLNKLSKDKVSKEDIVKTIAFQLGQTCALLERPAFSKTSVDDKSELYTKNEIISRYDFLRKYLMRESESLSKLEDFKNDFLNKVLLREDFSHISEEYSRFPWGTM